VETAILLSPCPRKKCAKKLEEHAKAMLFDRLKQPEKGTDGLDLDSNSRNNAKSSQATSLVPLERYHSVSRKHFILGVLLGVLISLGVTIPAFKYVNSRRNNAAAGAISTQGTAAHSMTGLQTQPASLPSTASNPLVANPKQASQHPLRLNPPAATSRTDATLPIRSKTPALITADQPVPGAVSSPLRETESGTVSASTLKVLWSRVQAGNINAALTLAELYIRGDGVTANCSQARVLLLMASKKGSAQATRRLQQLDTVCPATPNE
jgi:hypothetical protein